MASLRETPMDFGKRPMNGFPDGPVETDIGESIGFCHDTLARNEAIRGDRAAVAERLARADARFLLYCGARPVVKTEAAAIRADHDRIVIERLGADPETAIYLGERKGTPWFAIGGVREGGVAAPFKAIDLRSLAMQGVVATEIVSSLALGKSLVDWHERHGFCARCGGRSLVALAGWRRDCPGCGAEHFPRTDPVVIMLVTDGKNCLLGRQAQFPPGLYSALAGFVEPGETIEAAVRREVAEETGVVVGRVRYHASQPWPFPSSLMIGCIAEALSRQIVIDEKELEDARWFSRTEARAMLEARGQGQYIAPRPIAIAHWLLRAWLGVA